MEDNSKQNRIRNAIEKHGAEILRVSVGVIFLWFGFLKFFGSVSDAEDIAAKTISTITYGWIGEDVSMPLLAVIECLIGIGIISRRYMEYVIPVMYFQMAGTLLPLFIFTDETWKSPFVPTLLGQYIIKNAVLISAGIVLGALSKGGKLIKDPEIAYKAEKAEEHKESNKKSL